MPKITYIAHDGEQTDVEVAEGMSVMEGAVRNSVNGIDAECGGACSCATCHVYIDEQWWPKVGTASGNEAQMLDFANEVAFNSRLSCQIKVTAELDGLIVRMPASQH
jgi:ferredoxin, 2Fe-2S